MINEPLDYSISNKNTSGYIAVTDISEFIRLEQCERYLRLRLQTKLSGEDLLSKYGTHIQAIPPLLTLSGGEFEKCIEEAITNHFNTINFAKESGEKRQRASNNKQIIEIASSLSDNSDIVLFQSRLNVDIGGWKVSGDVDVILLKKDKHGLLEILIVDIKSSTEVKIEHRLQVAFYQLMIAKLFKDASVNYSTITTGILYRISIDINNLIDKNEIEQYKTHCTDAEKYFHLSNGLLEIISDLGPYTDAVQDIVLGSHSLAQKVTTTPFQNISYNLSYKCDGCLYNEFCMKWTAEHDDLSLLPYITITEKNALLEAGILSISELSSLKDFRNQDKDSQELNVELVPALGKEAIVKKLAATWPIGPRIDELIHRARRYRFWKKDPIDSLDYIPAKGYGSLPYSSVSHNPNLIRIYIDAQYDHLQDKIYMLGSLVVACKDGMESPERRKEIVYLMDNLPEHTHQERHLFINWIADTLKAIIDLAFPDKTGNKCAPIHIILFNKLEQKLLLEGLSRHFSTVLGATPLYDFMTQLAAFDSPMITFLDEEIRELKNYPMVCQSLQSVAAYLKFDWNKGEKYREIFEERMFDFWGKLEDENGNFQWYTNRSRFNSQIPLEFAYAAWNKLPQGSDDNDPFAPYRSVTLDLLKNFQVRRLEAIEHIAKDFKGNHIIEKQVFVLPELTSFTDKARTLAAALDEFLTIERHVELNDWKSIRYALPENRVLMGETLIVKYLESEQDEKTVKINLDNEQKWLNKNDTPPNKQEKIFDAKHHKLSKEQKKETSLPQESLKVRLRIEPTELNHNFDEILAISKFEEGSRLVIYPKEVYDERLPLDRRREYNPTPKQLLYGPRANLLRIIVERDNAQKAVSGYIEVEMKKSFSTLRRGYAFASIDRPFVNGKSYTLDIDPNNFYGYWCAEITELLCETESNKEKGRNTLYDRIAYPLKSKVFWPDKAATGQARFLAGLDVFCEIGDFHNFEASKRDYICSHGSDPILLVQGPPGTGKSYSTAFAIFARINGAMLAGIKFHVYISCKTHAATDVLLANIITVQKKLKKLYKSNPQLFQAYIDPRLLDLPLFRMTPKEAVPDEVIELIKDEERDKNEPHNVDRLSKYNWCIVASTPGGIRSIVKGKWRKSSDLMGHYFCNCLVLDEASQMNIPEATMAALPLCPDGQLIVVGDHRQMPPIVHHNWDSEPRRTFQEYKSYQSLFWILQTLNPPIIKFEESFRLHKAMAEFLRQEIYSKDGINYHSHSKNLLPKIEHEDSFVSSVLSSEHPIIVVMHNESESQTRNLFEQELISPILSLLADTNGYNLDSSEGLGVVVPHRMQKASLQSAFPFLKKIDSTTGMESLSAVDTVERFQGDERRVIIVSATESDKYYLLASSKFLLDPRRLTVAMSRAKQKMILVASRTIFSLFDPDEETFQNLQLWKNLLKRTCKQKLWEGERQGKLVEVWGTEPQELIQLNDNPSYVIDDKLNPLAKNLLSKLDQTEELYHRLILIVSSPNSGKTLALQTLATHKNLKYINVNLEVSQKLLELTERQRVLQLPKLLSDIISVNDERIVLLDNTEILFDISLKQDPLKLLQRLSRNRTIIATWNGLIDNGYLTYAEPEHPEYRRYAPAAIDALLVAGDIE